MEFTPQRPYAAGLGAGLAAAVLLLALAMRSRPRDRTPDPDARSTLRAHGDAHGRGWVLGTGALVTAVLVGGAAGAVAALTAMALAALLNRAATAGLLALASALLAALLPWPDLLEAPPWLAGATGLLALAALAAVAAPRLAQFGGEPRRGSGARAQTTTR